jgi:TonB family protein
MYLDQDDFAVFSRYFPAAWQVLLLVRPSTEGPAMGGFFFWEDGDVNRRSTYREFPFDRTHLVAGDFPITGGQPAIVLAARAMPVLLPKPKAHPRRRLPSLPWVVVPLIAILFLIAGLFVSENQETIPPEAAATKANPPVEPLLPEPGPQAATAPVANPQAEVSPSPVVGTPAPTSVAPAPTSVSPEPAAVAPARAVQPKPTAASKPKPKGAARPVLRVTPPPPVTVGRVPSREIEPPPALAAPIERIEPKLPGVLHSGISAPPPVAEVSYEAPRPGVLRRAFRKIEGPEAEAEAFVPPAPIRTIAPMKPADADAGTRPVDVKVFIDESGKVSRAQVLTKGSEFASAALSAARQWQFTPARKHGKAVASEMVLHFRF